MKTAAHRYTNSAAATVDDSELRYIYDQELRAPMAALEPSRRRMLRLQSLKAPFIAVLSILAVVLLITLFAWLERFIPVFALAGILQFLLVCVNLVFLFGVWYVLDGIVQQEKQRFHERFANDVLLLLTAFLDADTLLMPHTSFSRQWLSASGMFPHSYTPQQTTDSANPASPADSVNPADSSDAEALHAMKTIFSDSTTQARQEAANQLTEALKRDSATNAAITTRPENAGQNVGQIAQALKRGAQRAFANPEDDLEHYGVLPQPKAHKTLHSSEVHYRTETYLRCDSPGQRFHASSIEFWGYSGRRSKKRTSFFRGIFIAAELPTARPAGLQLIPLAKADASQPSDSLAYRFRIRSDSPQALAQSQMPDFMARVATIEDCALEPPTLVFKEVPVFNEVSAKPWLFIAMPSPSSRNVSHAVYESAAYEHQALTGEDGWQLLQHYALELNVMIRAARAFQQCQ